MVLAKPFSAPFWACYLGGGVSDALDGPLARALNTQSAAGAKLDSAADLAFAGAIAAVTVRNIKLPPWLWALAGGIGALRLGSYGLGYAKYRSFSAFVRGFRPDRGGTYPVLCGAFFISRGACHNCRFPRT